MLYCRANEKCNAMCIASPHSVTVNSIYIIKSNGSVTNALCDGQCEFRFRPVVCLNSNVCLEKTEDGVYTIK